MKTDYYVPRISSFSSIFRPRRLRLFLTLLLLSAGQVVYPQFSTEFQDEFRLLSSSSRGVRLVYEPLLVKESRPGAGNARYGYRAHLTTVMTQAGQPEIPVRTFVVGLPLSGQPTVRILAADFEEEEGVSLAPVPQITRTSDGLSVAQYIDSPADAGLAWLPQQLIQVESPAMLGDLRVLRLHVAPIQYQAANGRLRRYRRIEIQIDFPSAQGPAAGAELAPAPLSPRRARILQEAVVNYAEAANWRAGRVRRLQKQSRYRSNGSYYKFPVSASGVYRITGALLQQSGIDITAIDPGTIKIFNNGPQTLPKDVTSPRPDSLIENAIMVNDGGDNRFDAGDAILFFAHDVRGWAYEADEGRLSHFVNPYTHQNIYWLTFNDGTAGLRMQPAQAPGAATQTVQSYTAFTYIEDDINNLHNSGLIWYGNQFIGSGEASFALNLPNLASGEVRIRGQFLSTAGTLHQLPVRLDGAPVGTFTFTGARKYTATLTDTLTNISPSPDLSLSYSGSSQLSVVYLDWLEIQVESQLRLVDNRLDFYGKKGSAAVAYEISGATNGPYRVYDVTYFNDVREVASSILNGSILSFTALQDTSQPRRYYVARSDDVREVELLSPDEDSDLRNTDSGAEFVIITHESFFNAASSLKNLRESVDGLSTVLVKITDVFDEFSGGRYDPTAVRDFLKYAYDHWTIRPQYVLLFGDGDYDFRNILSNEDSNWIPTYQTEEAGELTNRTSDDWFGYVSGNDRLPDLTIGRIPSRTTAEAEAFVDKLVSYESSKNFGPWRNKFLMLADDELLTGGRPSAEVIHTRDAEDIVERFVPDRFDIRKIYLMEYPVVLDASASGVRKPLATEDLMNEINGGSLVVNFVGHGNPRLWTHERVLLDSRDADRIQNGDKYIFFITATCDFGRFDDPGEQSFAEELLMMENRGAISLLTSARLVFATPNADFNRSFLDELFQDPGSAIPVGDAMRLAKINTYSGGINNEKFHILGDPTLRLKVPELDIAVTDISPDSLKALSLITVQGQVLNPDGSAFGGAGSVSVQTLDSRRRVNYTTDFGNSVSFLLSGNPIFRGSGAVNSGNFQVQFIVPKDISYGGRDGRIGLYFEGEDRDGTGFQADLIVDGTATDLIDVDGPEIAFQLEDNPLVDFVILGTDNIITTVISDDKSGINITGDVGHKIIAVPDDDVQNARDVTQLFQYKPDNYLEGALDLPISLFFGDEEPQADQSHSLTVKAWDNANNSAQNTLQFRLIDSNNLVLENVLNYPNPFLSNTSFTFVLNGSADVEVKIYTLAGRLVAKLDPFPAAFGFNAIDWDGVDGDGDQIANGVYLYHLKARGVDESVEHIGKLIKMK